MSDQKGNDLVILSSLLVMLETGIAEQWNRVISGVNSFGEIAEREVPAESKFEKDSDGRATTSPETRALIESKLRSCHDLIRFDLYLLSVSVTMARKSIQTLVSHHQTSDHHGSTPPRLPVIWGRIHGLFDPFKRVRDHFEHLEQRLPSATTMFDKLRPTPLNSNKVKLSFGTIDLASFEMVFGSDRFSFSQAKRDQVLSAMAEVLNAIQGEGSPVD